MINTARFLREGSEWMLEEQARYAQERIARLGLADRSRSTAPINASVKGEYDKVSAICILEHVGSDNFADFYSTVHRSLKPGRPPSQPVDRPPCQGSTSSIDSQASLSELR